MKPLGKTAITFSLFSKYLKQFTWSGLRQKEEKLDRFRANPKWLKWLPKIISLILHFVVYYTQNFRVFDDHVTIPPHPISKKTTLGTRLDFCRVRQHSVIFTMVTQFDTPIFLQIYELVLRSLTVSTRVWSVEDDSVRHLQWPIQTLS